MIWAPGRSSWTYWAISVVLISENGRLKAWWYWSRCIFILNQHQSICSSQWAQFSDDHCLFNYLLSTFRRNWEQMFEHFSGFTIFPEGIISTELELNVFPLQGFIFSMLIFFYGADFRHSTAGLCHSAQSHRMCAQRKEKRGTHSNLWQFPLNYLGFWVKGTSWHFRGFQRAQREAEELRRRFQNHSFIVRWLFRVQKVRLIRGLWWPADCRLSSSLFTADA